MAATEHPIESTFLLGRLTLDKLPLDVPIVVDTFAVVAILGLVVVAAISSTLAEVMPSSSAATSA